MLIGNLQIDLPVILTELKKGYTPRVSARYPQTQSQILFFSATP